MGTICHLQQDVGDLEVWEGVFKDQGVYYSLNQGQISSQCQGIEGDVKRKKENWCYCGWAQRTKESGGITLVESQSRALIIKPGHPMSNQYLTIPGQEGLISSTQFQTEHYIGMQSFDKE